MKRETTLRKAFADKKLLGAELGGESWAKWRILLMALMGEKLRDGELDIFRQLTQRDQAPAECVSEFYGVIGRRGGKSKAIATLAVYLATMVSWKAKLSRGETGTILIIAADQRQARVILDYAAATLESSAILRQAIVRLTSDVIELTGNIVIEVRAASFRRLRGMTSIAIVADEVAYWLDDSSSSNPDTEILSAIRPTLATTGGPLICISSPYSRRGVLWQAWKDHFGPKGAPHILVAQAPSTVMNPVLPQSVVDRALETDPAKNTAEYLAEFRTDLEAFVSLEAVEACVDVGVLERPYDRRYTYYAFMDPSGGSSDSMTLAIAHKENQTAVLDCIREFRAPFDPSVAVEGFAHDLRRLHVSTVAADRYASEWVVEAFRKYGITVEASERTKSELYVDVLPVINSRLAGLLDSKVMVKQFVGLERQVARSGKDSIDHARGARDDVANAVAGALVRAIKGVTFVNPKWDTPLEVLMRHLPNPESPARAGAGMSPGRWPRGTMEELLRND
jgi:hypothetical protein